MVYVIDRLAQLYSKLPTSVVESHCPSLNKHLLSALLRYSAAVFPIRYPSPDYGLLFLASFFLP